MTNFAHHQAEGIVVGVDTHLDEHMAVAINHLGAHLGRYRLLTTVKGYQGLERWACSLGKVIAFGIEGTGCYGAGLSRFLTSRGHVVIEVNRPDRSTRRRLGKSDPIDAEMAARSVLADVADQRPKLGTDRVEMLRMLKSTKDSAIKARTQAMNQIRAIIVTAPEALRDSLRGLSPNRLIERCLGLRPGPLVTPVAAAKRALRSLARRHRQLTAEIAEIQEELETLVGQVAPELLKARCIGPDTAATLLITASDNPERLKSEAAFAALCGVSPIPASSGKTNRHRLNRGGDRKANAALYRIVIGRLKFDESTKAYMKRRTEEGMTKAEVIRCLKRYVARQVYCMMRELAQPPLADAA